MTAGGTRPARRSGGLLPLIIGTVLVIVGVAWLLDLTDFATFPWGVLLPGGLMLVGAALVAGARTGTHSGLIILGTILSLILAVTAWADLSLEAGAGERVIRPDSVAELEQRYSWGVGAQTLDLRDVEFPEGQTTIEVRQNVGELVVRLPDDVATAIDVRVGVGDATILGRSPGGPNVDTRVETPDFGTAQQRLVLDLSLGAGSIEVER